MKKRIRETNDSIYIDGEMRIEAVRIRIVDQADGEEPHVVIHGDECTIGLTRAEAAELSTWLAAKAGVEGSDIQVERAAWKSWALGLAKDIVGYRVDSGDERIPDHRQIERVDRALEALREQNTKTQEKLANGRDAFRLECIQLSDALDAAERESSALREVIHEVRDESEARFDAAYKWRNHAIRLARAAGVTITEAAVDPPSDVNDAVEAIEDLHTALDVARADCKNTEIAYGHQRGITEMVVAERNDAREECERLRDELESARVDIRWWEDNAKTAEAKCDRLRADTLRLLQASLRKDVDVVDDDFVSEAVEKVKLLNQLAGELQKAKGKKVEPAGWQSERERLRAECEWLRADLERLARAAGHDEIGRSMDVSEIASTIVNLRAKCEQLRAKCERLHNERTAAIRTLAKAAGLPDGGDGLTVSEIEDSILRRRERDRSEREAGAEKWELVRRVADALRREKEQ